jgi:sulfoxide reductase heme-binding subunit YedZ
MAKSFESWRLFWMLALTVSTAICLGLPFADFHTWRGTEFIILHAVLCALPFFLVAFTASSLATLWPSRRTRWLLSNRRYFGLAFAFGMAWHLTFVTYATITFGNRVSPRDLTLDFIAVSFLLAMTLTSFRRVARRLSLANWRRLHKTGVYTICFVVTFFYLDDIRSHWNPLYFEAACLLLAAWVLRIISWTQKRRRARHTQIEMPATRPAS